MRSSFQPLPRGESAATAITAVGLERFVRALERTDATLRGFMLVQDGAVTAERYWQPYEPEDTVWVYSISKSFTSSAVGFAVAEGLLDVDDRMVDLFAEKVPDEIGPHLAELRLRHLLSMSTGHAEDTALPIFMSRDSDWERVFLSLPIEHPPGTFFCYDSGASFMLAAAVERASGQGLLEYLTPRLFEPLGFDRVEWDRGPSGVALGGWGLMLRLEDLAKLGELYRAGGAWNGAQILDREWIRTATRSHIDNSQRDETKIDWRQGYGFQFWMSQHGAFRGDGAYGQFCIVFPEQRAVLALMSEIGDMQQIMDAVWAELLPELNRLPAEAIGERTYILHDGDHGASELRFGIEADGVLTLTLAGPGGEAVLRAGEGEWVETTSQWTLGEWLGLPHFSFHELPLRTSAHYRRTAADTYEIEWLWHESPHRATAVIAVEEERITLTIPARWHAERIAAQGVTLRGTRT